MTYAYIMANGYYESSCDRCTWSRMNLSHTEAVERGHRHDQTAHRHEN